MICDYLKERKMYLIVNIFLLFKDQETVNSKCLETTRI